MSTPIESAHDFGRGIATAPSRPAVQALMALPDLAYRLSLSVLVDALREATPAYWVRRAEALEAVGTPSGDDAARECRRHAWLLAQMTADQVAESFELGEVAA